MMIWPRMIKNYFIFSMAVCFLSVGNSYGQEDHMSQSNLSEGYELKFDSEQYLKEREIAYQYYSRDVFQNKDFPIARDEIAVALYDLDDDGQDEIFALLNHSFYCGSNGCPLIILKSEKDQNALIQIKYNPIRFGLSEYDTELTVYEINPLKLKTLGFYDLSFEDRDGKHIFRWQGEYYSDE